MTNRPAYREHVPRIRTSLDRVLGEAATSERELRAMAARAWRQSGVVVFLADDLKRMPEWARMMVEAEATRIHGPAMTKNPGE